MGDRIEQNNTTNWLNKILPHIGPRVQNFLHEIYLRIVPSKAEMPGGGSYKPPAKSDWIAEAVTTVEKQLHPTTQANGTPVTNRDNYLPHGQDFTLSEVKAMRAISEKADSLLLKMDQERKLDVHYDYAEERIYRNFETKLANNKTILYMTDQPRERGYADRVKYEALEKSGQLPENISDANTTRYAELRKLREDRNKIRAARFQTQVEEAAQLVQLRNDFTEKNPNPNPWAKEYLGKIDEKIAEINKKMVEQDFATGSTQLYKNALANYEGVVERKLALTTRHVRLFQMQGAKTAEEEKANDKEMAAIVEELQKAPDMEQMEKYLREAKWKALQGGILTSKEMKLALQEQEKLFAWGSRSFNHGRANPANWTDVRRLAIVESGEGRYFVTVEINQPIITKAEGNMTPFGLKETAPFNKTPSNFFKVTEYLVDEKGEVNPDTVMTHYRGGYLPTKEAARVFLEKITENGSTDLHINALLTATALTPIRDDRKLLETHVKNIRDALQEMIKVEQDPSKKEQLTQLNENISFANQGVNEGATGGKKIAGYPLRLGWHHAVEKYNNASMERMNQRIEMALDNPNEQVMRNLPAIVHVAQELEQVWARNDYGREEVGDQLKMAVLSTVLCKFLGVDEYDDCAAGKDRTGRVKADANAYSAELMMALRSYSGPYDIETARMALGLEKDGPGLFQRKSVSPHFQIGLHGISTNPPLAMDPKRKEAALSLDQGHLFPNYYAKEISALESLKNQKSILEMDPKLTAHWKEQQRLQVNRRLKLLGGSLHIAQMNTGVFGYKLRGGKSLDRISSGFDRNYVIVSVLKHQSESIDVALSAFESLTGLRELNETERTAMKEQAKKILSNQKASDYEKATQLSQLLSRVEKLKMTTITPQRHVPT